MRLKLEQVEMVGSQTSKRGPPKGRNLKQQANVLVGKGGRSA